MDDYSIRFGSISRLYGDQAVESFKRSHIAIVGLGGVGSWVVEALARTGIGTMTLVDMDEVCLSNVNRQIQALSSTVGQSKAQSLKERIGLIAPDCKVIAQEAYYTEKNSEALLEADFDYIVDAIDSVAHKCLLISQAKKKGLNIITCGGAGGKLDPTRLKVADLSKTRNDPLLTQVRKRLRKMHGFSKYSKKKFHIDCVYSDEIPKFPQLDGSISCEREKGADYRLNCDTGFGSSTMLTGSMGFFLASAVLNKLKSKEA